MQRASTAFLVTMVISSLSLWGCTNQKNGAANSRIRELEHRHIKLDEDYRAIVSANEANRRKIIQIDAQRAELTQKIDELQAAVKDHDDLKAQLLSRTEERDGAQMQLLQFSKDLQSLASRAQTAAARSFGNGVSAQAASRKLP